MPNLPTHSIDCGNIEGFSQLDPVWAAWLALASYRRREETDQAWEKKLDRKLGEFGGTAVYKRDDALAFDAELDGHYIVAVRGSDNPFDWVRNASIRLTDWRGDKWHAGFLKDASNLFELLKEEFKHQYQQRAVHLVGHSLGGATATVLASLCWENDIKVSSLTTFGAPRFGNRLAAGRMHTLMGNRFRRFVNCCDPVPQVLWSTRFLPFSTGHFHAGQLNYFDREKQLNVDPSFWWCMFDRTQAWFQTSNLFSQITEYHSMAEYHSLVRKAFT